MTKDYEVTYRQLSLVIELTNEPRDLRNPSPICLTDVVRKAKSCKCLLVHLNKDQY